MLQLRTKTTQSDGERTLTDDEICKQVLGTKSGYIKGCGFGPRPPPVHAVHLSTSELHHRNTELEEKLLDTQQIVLSQNDEIVALI